METPLYLVERGAGHEVPLPGTACTITVKKNAELQLLTTPVMTTLEAEPSQRFVLGFVKPAFKLIDLYQSTTDISKDIEPVGILCHIIHEETDADDNHVALIEGLSRVHIELTADTRFPPTCHTIFVHEVLSQEEAVLGTEIQVVTKLLKQHPGIFAATDINLLTTATSALEQLNHLVKLTRPPTDDGRIEYIVELDNFKRFDYTMQAIHAHLRASITQNKKKLSKSRPVKKKPENVRGHWQNESLSFKERLDLLPAHSEVKENIAKKVKKLENLPPSSTEHGLTLDWLEWTFSLPWEQAKYKDDFDLASLRQEMDATHYGLDDVKDTLIEHMCIERLRAGSMGSVICFVGSPGTGKSTLARSISKAASRPFQTIALGGLGDEAELRGHRSTYVGALPGRIITALRNANSLAPTILLDEVDKLGSHHRGDPASALLEILDPAQNHEFVDRYLGFPVDLSKVMWICTANYLEQIPEALRDRLEIIHFREYTFKERQHILQDYLLPKCIGDYNLTDAKIDWPNEVLNRIAQTVQVRQMEKQVRALLRKYAVQLYVYEAGPQIATITDLRTDHGFTKRKVGFT